MRKAFIVCGFVVAGAFLIGCGGESARYTPPPVTNSNQFVFLRGQPTPTPTATPEGSPTPAADVFGPMQAVVASLTSNGHFSTQIVGEPEDIFWATFSTDGQKAAAVMPDWGRSEIDVLVSNADGTGVINVSRTPSMEYGPALSRDKTKVLWIDTSNMGIRVANADGTGTPVDITGDYEVPFLSGSFSPDGNTIVAGDYFMETIYLVNTDGSGISAITTYDPKDSVLGYMFPIFSADGSKIIYTQADIMPDDPETEEDESYIAYNLYSMNPDGTEPEQLTGGELDFHPLLAGDRLMYQSLRNGNWEIYTVREDGSGSARLTGNNVFDGFIPILSVSSGAVRSEAATTRSPYRIDTAERLLRRPR